MATENAEGLSSMEPEELLAVAASKVDELLNLPHQRWLLGAGVSFDAGIPLMYPLTERIEAMLDQADHPFNGVDVSAAAAFCKAVRKELPKDSHIEHVLSHLADTLSLADRTSTKATTIDSVSYSVDQLRTIHSQILTAIRHTVEFGYRPKGGKTKELIGNAAQPIISADGHIEFVDALFFHRRKGLDSRPPVQFFTTNYDTLLEDSLAAKQVRFSDGFNGGGTGFWEPRDGMNRHSQIRNYSGHSAVVCKLHGSVDWRLTADDLVLRVRSTTLVGENDRLLIYPQATKYQVTQRDPFATLFSEFRDALSGGAGHVLAICGYSFGDDHINEEIERALRSSGNNLTVLAFVKQSQGKSGELTDGEGLPPTVKTWLETPQPWSDRLLVAGSRGFYKGSLTNQLGSTCSRELPWWTFSGMSSFLKHGAEALS